MKRVLVTGSSGEIGSALVHALLADPAIDHVVGIDLSPSSRASSADRFRFKSADIIDPCPSLLIEHSIDTVIHTAYPVEPAHDPMRSRRTAVTGTRSILQSAQAAGVAAFLHLSSATVYGSHPENPQSLTETASLRPNRGFHYALDKLAAEKIVVEYRAAQAFSTLLMLRPCFVIGPGTANAFVHHLCRPIVPLPATQSPMQFVHRDDLTRIILGLLRAGAQGTFNVGAPGSLTAQAMVHRLHGRSILVPDGLLTVLNTLAWHSHWRVASAPTPAIDLLRHPWRVDSTAIQQWLPHPYRYTTAEAFQTFADSHLLTHRTSK
jgi:UDP-glucose 4-epimerase